jgi:hypothetical protein
MPEKAVTKFSDIYVDTISASWLNRSASCFFYPVLRCEISKTTYCHRCYKGHQEETKKNLTGHGLASH